MCLSSVYRGEVKDNRIIIKEASLLKVRDDEVIIENIFGQSESLKGYYIKEVNLVKNYVILDERRNDG